MKGRELEQVLSIASSFSWRKADRSASALAELTLRVISDALSGVRAKAKRMIDILFLLGLKPVLVLPANLQLKLEAIDRSNRQDYLLRACLILAFAGISISAQNTAPSTNGTSATPTITAEQLTRLERAENKLKDWPNLGRYREANAKITPPAKNEDRVIFIGDSITDSWKLAEYFPGRPYINRGISGQTTPQMLIRFRPDVIELRPKVVVIFAGTNDLAGNTGPMSLDAIQHNLASMTELAHAHGIRVVLASMMPINNYAVRDGKPIIQSVKRPPEKIVALNKWIRDFAASTGVVYLDYYSAMVDEKGFLKAELGRDGLHPTPQGYEVMKQLAEQAIRTALKKKQK